jgi:hypothetical protein
VLRCMSSDSVKIQPTRCGMKIWFTEKQNKIWHQL